MEHASTVSTKAARWLLVALFAFNVYRAATQAITTDEAIAFDCCVRPPLHDILSSYHDHNHFLDILLIKRSVGLFRLSEFAFRLPDLLGGALYLWGVYRLARRAFGGGAWMVAAVATLAFNPLVLDPLSTAGGFAIALALLTWAVEPMLDYLESDGPFKSPNLNLAGACVGLAVATQLSFVLPAAVLVAAFAIGAAARGRLSTGPFLERLVASAVVVAFVFLAIPMSHAAFSDVTEAAGSLALRAPSYRAHPPEAAVRDVARFLRATPGAEKTMRMAASPEFIPALRFYQARYRIPNLHPAEPVSAGGAFDCYVLGDQDLGLIAERHLQVVYSGPGIALAR